MASKLVSNSNFRKSIPVFILILVILAIITITQTPMGVLKNINYYYLFLAFVFSCGVIIFEILRFFTITRIYKEIPFNFFRSSLISLCSIFFAKITPGGAGGEPTLFLLLNKEGLSPGRSAAIILINGVISLSSRVIIILSLPLLAMRNHLSLEKLSLSLTLYILGIILILFLLTYPLFINKVLNFLLKNRFTLKLFGSDFIKNSVGVIIKFINDIKETTKQLKFKDWLLISATYLFINLGWISTFVVPYAILKSMGVIMPFSVVIIYTMIMRSITDLSPTPGSTVTQEAGIALLFNHMLGEESLWLFVFIWRILAFYFPLAISGIFTVLRLGEKITENMR